jgi:O-antigen ligase
VKFGLTQKRRITTEWVLFWTFIAALAWTPYWYGSNDLITWGVNAVLFPGLTLIYEIALVVRGRERPVAVHELRLPISLFVAVALWVVVQDATWTPSSWHHPIWAMSADALNAPLDGSISVNRNATTLALIRIITSASVFWLAVQLCRNTTRASSFIIALVTIIAAYCAYGLVDFATMQSEKTDGPSFLTSTFINHNHFAAYGGIGLVAGCGQILKIFRGTLGTRGGSLRFKIATFMETAAHNAGPFLVAAFVILVAVLLTGSRGGITATGLGIASLAVLMLGQREVKSSERRLALILGIIVVAAILMFFGSTFTTRLAEQGLSDRNRMTVYMITLRSILDAPVLGYGYGTFADVFPMIRDRSVSVLGSWEQAHDTYLEVFQGLGVVFGSMLVLSVAVLVAKCCKAAITHQEAMIPAVATSVGLLLGIHSLVDFSLQIQAVTLTFMAVLGAGVAQAQPDLAANGGALQMASRLNHTVRGATRSRARRS